MSNQDNSSGETSTTSKTSHSSTTSLTQSIEKVDGSIATGQSNYNTCRFRIIRILKEKDQLEAIEERSTPVGNVKDDQAFTIITLNIKDSQIPHIEDATTAYKAWMAMKEVHQGIKTNGRMTLMQHLWALKMAEGQDMAQHLNQFRGLANQLPGLLGEGKGLDDSELVTMLTLSLPESYEPLVMALQSQTDQITFDVMAGRLLQESARRHFGQVTHKTHEHAITASSQFAFTANCNPRNQRGFAVRPVSHVYGRGRGGFRGRFRGRSAANTTSSKVRSTAHMRCHYRGKEDHWKKDYYK